MSEYQTPTAPGNHPLLEAIAAFIQSPAGQALVQILVTALITSVTPKQAATVVALAARHNE